MTISLGAPPGYSPRPGAATNVKYAMARRTSVTRHGITRPCQRTSMTPSSNLASDATVPGPRHPVKSLFTGSRQNSTWSSGFKSASCPAGLVLDCIAVRSRSSAMPRTMLPTAISRTRCTCLLFSPPVSSSVAGPFPTISCSNTGTRPITATNGVCPWTLVNAFNTNKDSSSNSCLVIFNPSSRACERFLLYCCLSMSFLLSMICACALRGFGLSSRFHLSAQMLPSSLNRAPSWSLTMYFGGPHNLNQMWLIAGKICRGSLPAIHIACAHRVHIQMMCTAWPSSKKIRSSWMPSLNCEVMFKVVIGLLPRLAHSRHPLHVSITRCTSCSTSFGSPAAERMSLILCAGACHSRTCNFLKVFKRTCGTADLRD